VTFNNKRKLDLCSEQGARVLARAIAFFWQTRGVAVETWVQKENYRGTDCMAVYSVRSRFPGGMPAETPEAPS
jgi:hypothetical protein